MRKRRLWPSVGRYETLGAFCRGLGSIRQDLNVSVACGDRVEIKGCQDLGWIPRIVRLEMVRQVHMYRLANELRSSLGLPPLPSNRDLDDIGMNLK